MRKLSSEAVSDCPNRTAGLLRRQSTSLKLVKKGGFVHTFTICNFSFTPNSPKRVLPTDKQKKINGNIVGSLITPRHSQEDTENQEDTALLARRKLLSALLNPRSDLLDPAILPLGQTP